MSSDTNPDASPDMTRNDAFDLFRREPDRFIDVDNGEVGYWSVGTGPDVVFSHGWPANSATFAPMLPYLVNHVTCHLIDLPGAGQSRFDRTITPSLTTHADALRRVVDELALTSFGVVGHDSGGMIARLAFAGDDRVHGWGLIDTEQPPKPHWRFSSFIAVRHLPRFMDILAWAVNQRRLRRNKFVLGDIFRDKDLLDREFEEFVLRPLADDADRRWAAGRFAENFDLGQFAAMAECHRKITQPTQLVWGENDAFFPVERTRDMMSEFAGPVELEVIPRAKVFAHEEFPEPAATALLRTIVG